METYLVQMLPLSNIMIKTISCIYILSDHAYFITFILLVYRINILNKIEFGRLPSNKYSKYMSRLKNKWNIIISIVFTLVFGMPIVIIYLLRSDHDEPFNIFYFKARIQRNAKILFGLIGFFSLLFLQFGHILILCLR